MRHNIFHLFNLLILTISFVAMVLLADQWFHQKRLQKLARHLENSTELFNNFCELELRFVVKKELSYIDDAFRIYDRQIGENVAYQEFQEKFPHFVSASIGTEWLSEPFSVTREALFIAHREREALLALYMERLLELSKQIYELGLDHNSGYYGELRKSIHDIEATLMSYGDYRIMTDMLMLRRHEKDFMLRGSEEYLLKFEAAHLDLINDINRSNILNKPLHIALLDNYRNQFRRFVHLYGTIGLGNNSGLLGETKKISEEFGRQSELLKAGLEERMHQSERNIIFLVRLVGVVVIIEMLLYFLIRRQYKNAESINPLTKLNGNESINRYIRNTAMLEKERFYIYFDFNLFKPFNDSYGYDAGDQAILTFSYILKKQLKGKNFIGHIGGDDFFVGLKDMRYEKVHRLVQGIAEEFEMSVRTLYSETDLNHGYMVQKDRFDVERKLPLMSVTCMAIHLPSDYELHNEKLLGTYFAALKESAKKQKCNFVAVSLLNSC